MLGFDKFEEFDFDTALFLEEEFSGYLSEK